MASDPSGNVYEKVVGTPLGGADALPPPRVSAAVVLWRRVEGGGPDDVEVYWVKRAEALAFMGGWHAFPGGGLSKSDAGLPVSGAPQLASDAPPAAGLPESLRDLDEPSPDLLPGLAACALRELFEETGILLSSPTVDPEDTFEPRRALLAGERKFSDVLQTLGVKLDASPLVYAGRWVTPPFAPIRFDNRFFLLEWPPDASSEPAARERLGRKVTAIWLTHHHPDHVGGVERLRASLGVPVLAHPLTAERLAGRGIRIDGELRDGERVLLGDDFPVLILHTPGHARGHLCFLEEGQRSLLCGDIVS